MNDLVTIEKICVRVLESPVEHDVPMSFSKLSARRTFLIEVHGGGLVGIGESWINYPDWGHKERLATVLEGVAPLIIGHDASDPGAILDHLHLQLAGIARQWGAPGPVWQAISGIDLALWDLRGKVAGVPTSKLFEHVRSAAPAYASGVGPTDVRDLTERALDMGLEAVKAKVGFGKERDRDTITTIREVSEDIRIFADANQAWTLSEAIESASWMLDLGVELLEEPIRGDWSPDLAKLHEMTGMDLATGENVYGLDSLVSSARTPGVVHIQPDPAKSGGLTIALRLAQELELMECRLSPHWYAGGIGLRSCVALSTMCREAGWVELDIRPNPLRDDLLSDGFAIADGKIYPNASAGLVGDLDLESVAHYQIYVEERTQQ